MPNSAKLGHVFIVGASVALKSFFLAKWLHFILGQNKVTQQVLQKNGNSDLLSNTL